MKEAGFQFEIRTLDTDESFPDDLPKRLVASYLAEKKAAAFKGQIGTSELLITSDTTVLVDDIILNKPEDRNHAIEMLKMLSGRSHLVITGVCLSSKLKTTSFEDITEVFFRKLSEKEIIAYIDDYQPYDKAGAYGIQERIGLIGIEKIIGSYFNVMGLPVHKLYKELQNF